MAAAMDPWGPHSPVTARDAWAVEDPWPVQDPWPARGAWAPQHVTAPQESWARHSWSRRGEAFPAPSWAASPDGGWQAPVVRETTTWEALLAHPPAWDLRTPRIHRTSQPRAVARSEVETPPSSSAFYGRNPAAAEADPFEVFSATVPTTPSPALPKRRDVRRAEEAEVARVRRRDLREARRQRPSPTMGTVAARAAVVSVLGAVGVVAVTGGSLDVLMGPGQGTSSATGTLRESASALAELAGLASGSSDWNIAVEMTTLDRTARRLENARMAAAKASAVKAAKAVAARAASKAAAEARAEALSQATRQAQRDPKAIARILAADRGWGGSQFMCLDRLWNRESGWNYAARNRSSGAYGIPQSLPGSKMAAVGSDWRTNPVTQIKWGLAYIADRYGTPCGAWAHSQATGWY